MVFTVKIDRGKLREDIAVWLEYNPGASVGQLYRSASRLTHKTDIIRPVVASMVEDGEVIRRRCGQSAAFFLASQDPGKNPTSNKDRNARKILDALADGQLMMTEVAKKTGLNYNYMAVLAREMARKKEIQVVRFSCGRMGRVVYALPGVRMIPPKTYAEEKNDTLQSEMADLMKKLIPIMEGRRMSLSQIIGELTGDDTDTSGREYSRFLSLFKSLVRRGKVRARKCAHGNIYSLKAGRRKLNG